MRARSVTPIAALFALATSHCSLLLRPDPAELRAPEDVRIGDATGRETSANDGSDTRVTDDMPATSCTDPLVECNGACVDTHTDAQNCGSCGNACAADTVCADGACSTSGCPDGTTNCGGSCVDTQTSNAHCGGCDHACGPGATCNGGNCGCTDGLTSCGDACVDLANDPAHCGSCENACTTGVACSSGACTCAAGAMPA